MEAQNRIAVFRNDKGDNQKRPDYRGDIELTEQFLTDAKALVVDGKVKAKLSLWVRESKAGVKYMSGPVELPSEQNNFDQKATDRPEQNDLPF